MKAYRVIKGFKSDHYGYKTNMQEAEYFFNKEDAMALIQTSAYEYTYTKITDIRNGGTSTTGARFYDKRKANAEPYEKVELITDTEYKYILEEIEIK